MAKLYRDIYFEIWQKIPKTSVVVNVSAKLLTSVYILYTNSPIATQLLSYNRIVV